MEGSWKILRERKALRARLFVGAELRPPNPRPLRSKSLATGEAKQALRLHGWNFLLQERHFGGGPIHQAVAGQSKERGRGVAGIEREIHGQSDAAHRMRGGRGMRQPVGKSRRVHEEPDRERQRIRPQSFPAIPDSRKLGFRRKARAFKHMQPMAGYEERPQMCILGKKHVRSTLANKDVYTRGELRRNNAAGKRPTTGF
jgi:hypothetical protein